MSSRSEQGMTSIIGNLLLVAVVVFLGITISVFSLLFLEGVGAPTADATFEYTQTPAGLRMTPVALGTDATVRLNGQDVATFSADSAGQSVLLPTAPDDRITVVSNDGEKSILVTEEIDERSETGDLIAYYNFEEGSGSTVVDQSGNGNDGTAHGGYTRVSQCGGAMDFDGTPYTYVDVGDLTLVGPDSINEMTVAIKYQHDGGSSHQKLIEHSEGSFSWYMSTDTKHGDPHQMEFDIGWANPPFQRIRTGDIPAGSTQVLVGTYDGKSMSLYRNGKEVDTKGLDREVELGQINLAADHNPGPHIQNLDGRLCEVRLYYTAFTEDQVQVLTNTME